QMWNIRVHSKEKGQETKFNQDVCESSFHPEDKPEDISFSTISRAQLPRKEKPKMLKEEPCSSSSHETQSKEKVCNPDNQHCESDPETHAESKEYFEENLFKVQYKDIVLKFVMPK
ncbi:hypothetical protein NPIL_474501, partial [Nephila pilipes]